MIQIEQIRNYFPAQIRQYSIFDKHILKEYLQLMILDYLSSTPNIRKMTIIGGTSLRLVKGIDRFSGDLDFDCKDQSKDEFIEMTNGVVQFLERSGLRVETKDKDNPKLTAFRRNIYFPELLKTVDLKKKQKDFEHLLFNKSNSGKILRFGEFVDSLTD